MTRRHFLRLCGSSAFSVLFSAWNARANIKPNILFIMADDLGYECLESYGGTSYETANLNKLAREGVRFTHCYATPLCSPTRVELMTGKYPFRTGWTKLITARPDDQEFLDASKETTFAHLLKAAGYKTVCVGKWQLAHFDQIPDHVVQCGFDNYSCWTWKYGGKKPSRYWNPGIWQDGRLREDVAEKYGPDIVSDYLVDFIRKQRDVPFFAYYPMILTHNPFVATPDSADKIGASEQEYFGDMVQYMDKIVGKIVGVLEELALREKTIIFFTGDNGTNKSITSSIGDTKIAGGKGKLTDAGTHVPLLVSWKGTIESNKVCRDLVDFSDFFPTIAELADVSLPSATTADGHSILPALMGNQDNAREWIYVQLGNNYFIRTHRWKLFNNNKFYDMESDPFENNPITPDSDTIESGQARTMLQGWLEELLSLSTFVQSLSDEMDLGAQLKCYPNPFNSHILITFSTRKHGEISLTIYDITGRKVRSLAPARFSDSFQAMWDGLDDEGKRVGSGTYIVVLNSETFQQSTKVIFAK